LSGVKATLSESGDLKLAWRLDAASAKTAEVWVRWTADKGETWHALTIGLRGGSAIVPAEQLPSGEVTFELLAHDGFHTTRASSEPLALPHRPPAVAILYPRPSGTVYDDRLIHLWGTASSHRGVPISADAAQWFIDDKPAGTGFDLWVDNPGPGPHALRLRVREGAMEGEAELSFSVAGETPQPR
jgi:hypothetical protein